jgi:hypothetical protein
MSSRWFVQCDGLADLPVSFHELAVLIATGKVSEADLVRDECGSDWIPADSVIGLSREVTRVRQQHSLQSAGLSSEPAVRGNPAIHGINPANQKSAVPSVNNKMEFGRPPQRPLKLVPRRAAAFFMGWALLVWMARADHLKTLQFPTAGMSNPDYRWFPFVGEVRPVEHVFLWFDVTVLGAVTLSFSFRR